MCGSEGGRKGVSEGGGSEGGREGGSEGSLPIVWLS